MSATEDVAIDQEAEVKRPELKRQMQKWKDIVQKQPNLHSGSKSFIHSIFELSLHHSPSRARSMNRSVELPGNARYRRYARFSKAAVAHKGVHFSSARLGLGG